MKTMMLLLFAAAPAWAMDYSSLCELNQPNVSKAATQARNDFNEKNIRGGITQALSKSTGIAKLEITLFDMNSQTIQINANGKLVDLGFTVVYPNENADEAKADEAKVKAKSLEAKVEESIPDERKAVADEDKGPDLVDKAKEFFTGTAVPKIDVVTESSLAKDKSFDKLGNFISPEQISCDVSVHLQKTAVIHIFNRQTNIPVTDVIFDAGDAKNHVDVPVIIPLKTEEK